MNNTQLEEAAHKAWLTYIADDCCPSDPRLIFKDGFRAAFDSLTATPDLLTDITPFRAQQRSR